MHKNYGIWGEFFYEIVDDKTKKIVEKGPKTKNLILNQGLDFLAARSFVENVQACCASQSTVGPLFTDTSLTAEFDRTATLDTSLQISASASLNGNIFSFTRIFKFDTSVNPNIYGTLGWSYTTTPGANLFSKAVILTTTGGPGPIFVASQQYLRVHYTINITISPSATTNGNSNILNLPGSDGGTFDVQLIGLKTINSQNVVGFFDAGQDCNELYSNAEIFVSSSSSALSAFGSSMDRSGATSNSTKTSNNVYQGPGTGIMYKSTGFGKNNSVFSINSMGIGVIGSSVTNSGFVYVFTSPQAKSALFNFKPTFVYTVTRH